MTRFTHNLIGFVFSTFELSAVGLLLIELHDAVFQK